MPQPVPPDALWHRPDHDAPVRRIASGRRAGLDIVGDLPERLLRRIVGMERRPIEERSVVPTPFPLSGVSVVDLPGATAATVTVRGLGHEGQGTARQDQAASVLVEGSRGRYLVAAVADGVSSASESQWGAFAACSGVLHTMQDRLREGGLDGIDWPGVLDEVRRNMGERLLPLLTPLPDAAGKDRQQAVPKVPTSDAERPGGLFRRWRKGLGRTSARHDATEHAAEYATERETDVTAVAGTTCEALVVELRADRGPDEPLRFVRTTLAGDGSAYLFDRTQGILSLGTAKAIGRGSVDNAVHPLPGAPGPAYPIVRPGEIGPGQALMLTTDGVGDDMSVEDGSVADSDVAAYLWHRLSRPVPGHELLRIMGYVCGTSFDDRSAVIVWA